MHPVRQVVEGLCGRLLPLGLWQLKLVSAYYRGRDGAHEDNSRRLVSAELLEATLSATQQWLTDWQNGEMEPKGLTPAVCGVCAHDSACTSCCVCLY